MGGDVRDDAQETGPEVQARTAQTDRRYQEAFLSVAAQLGMSNRAPNDVLIALTDRLTERDHLHQVVADIAEAGGVDRQAPVRDLTNQVREMTGQAPMPLQLAEIVGVDPSTPARETLQRVRELQAGTKTADLLADELGRPRGTPVGRLLEHVSQLRVEAEAARSMIDRDGMATSEEVGLMRELAEEVRSALELPPEARNAAVLNRIANLQATVADLTEPPVETVTMEEVERQRETRLGALTKTLELWRAHQMGDVPGVEDLVAMAEWLVSGDTGPAAAANDAMVRRGLEHQRQQGGVVDGARWTPGDHVG